MLRQLSVWTVWESKAGIIQTRKSFLWGFPMFETSVTLGWKYSDSVMGIGTLSVIVIVIVFVRILLLIFSLLLCWKYSD